VKDLTLHIEGMSCGHCVNAVSRALSAVPGVEIGSVKIGQADVRYDEAAVNRARIEEAVTEAGYHARSVG